MKLTKDLVSGLLFLILGAGAAAIASTYEIGTAVHMGPGYFPILLGALIALMGLFLMLRAVIYPASTEPVDPMRLRPLLMISLAVGIFSFVLAKLGLIAALVVLVFLSRLADEGARWRESVAMAAVICAVCYLVFVVLLQVRIPVVAW